MIILHRILAVAAGFAVIVLLSIATDLALEKTMLPGLARAEASTGVWIFVTIYRAIYSILGCWIAARLAPDRPMTHALVLGVIGLLLSTAGAIAMWSVGTHWYPIALIIIALPCAWIGGKLATRS